MSGGDGWWRTQDVSPVEWERLGQHVRRDRVRLGMRTQGQLAARAGVSKRTVSDIERGARPNISADTLGAIEAALGWAPGAASEVLRGLTPEQADADLSRIVTLWPQLGERERQIIAAIVNILSDTPG